MRKNDELLAYPEDSSLPDLCQLQSNLCSVQYLKNLMWVMLFMTVHAFTLIRRHTIRFSETLYHCTPGIIVGVLVDLLEESIQCSFAFWLFIIDFFTQFVPVVSLCTMVSCISLYFNPQEQAKYASHAYLLCRRRVGRFRFCISTSDGARRLMRRKSSYTVFAFKRAPV